MSNDLEQNFGCATIAGMMRACRSARLLLLAIGAAPRGRPTTRSRARACSTTSGSSTRRCSAAEQARLTPARADAADLVAARAYLERFRESAASDDLTNARDRLRRLDPQTLRRRASAPSTSSVSARRCSSTARSAPPPTVFDSVAAAAATLLAGDARERVLDWWASALDRDAKPRPEIERQGVYQRIRARMDEELATHPGSGAAAYWLAAAARAQGDLQAAWDAAQAGWVRAPLASDHGAALRADLDRLVLRAIVPDRAKATAQPPEIAAPAVGAVQGALAASGTRSRSSDGVQLDRRSIPDSRLRVLPVLADADVDRQRHVQRRRRLHPLADDRGDLLGARLRHLEQQLVVDGEDHPRVGVRRRARRGRRSSRAS